MENNLAWNEIEKVKVDPHKFLVFSYSKESEEWNAYITLWNHDFNGSYKFQVDSNTINGQKCYIVRPRNKGILDKQCGFGKRISLKVNYELKNDVPIKKNTKEIGRRIKEELRLEELDQRFSQQETRRFFKLQVWQMQEPKQLIRCQFLLPIFFCPQMLNTEVFVYPESRISFNRNQGNQYSYWKNNFYIINNSSRLLYYKILTTRLPNNCDMVVFPTKGCIQHSYSDVDSKSKEADSNYVGADEDEADQHYKAITVLLLHPEKAYAMQNVKKPIVTIVLLFSYQKHCESEQLDDLLQWANCKQTIEVYVHDISANVMAKTNQSAKLKQFINRARANNMQQVYGLFQANQGSTQRLKQITRDQYLDAMLNRSSFVSNSNVSDADSSDTTTRLSDKLGQNSARLTRIDGDNSQRNRQLDSLVRSVEGRRRQASELDVRGLTESLRCRGVRVLLTSEEEEETSQSSS